MSIREFRGNVISLTGYQRLPFPEGEGLPANIPVLSKFSPTGVSDGRASRKGLARRIITEGGNKWLMN